jgi:hypothetical protein
MRPWFSRRIFWQPCRVGSSAAWRPYSRLAADEIGRSTYPHRVGCPIPYLHERTITLIYVLRAAAQRIAGGSARELQIESHRWRLGEMAS